MAGIRNYMASLMIVVQENFWWKNLNGLIKNAARSSDPPRTDHLTENRECMSEVSLAITAFSCSPLFTLSRHCLTVLWYPRLRRYLQIFTQTSEFLHWFYITSMLRIHVCAHAWTTVSCRTPSFQWCQSGQSGLRGSIMQQTAICEGTALNLFAPAMRVAPLAIQT